MYFLLPAVHCSLILQSFEVFMIARWDQ